MSSVRFIGAAAEPGGDRELDDRKIAAIADAAGLGPHGPALLQAFADVEVSHLRGFLSDGRLRILFEAHRFDHYTQGAFRESHPNISSARWNSDLYWGGAAEYRRLETAMALDEDAALKSASWGWFQIMGDEFWRCEYETPAEMISAFADSAHVQVMAVVNFLRSKKLTEPLMAFNFERVSHGYNGPGYRKNRHHLKLSAAVARRSGLGGWCALGGAGPEVVELQEALNRDGAVLNLDGAVLNLDGAFGPKTANALLNFQCDHRLPHPLTENWF